MAEKHLQLRKPRLAEAPSATVDVEALINRGGSAPVHESPKLTKDSRKSVIVYFEPGDLLRVDQACSARRIKTSRQRWLMEAILEKLDREATNDPQ